MILLVVAIYLLVALVAVLVLFGSGILFGQTILNPLLKASSFRSSAFRLYTSDFFALTLLLTLPAMLVGNFRDPEMPFGAALILCLIPFAVSSWAWFRGATKLSGANVTNVAKRFVFLALLLPLVLYGSTIGVPFAILSALAILTRPASWSPILSVVGLLTAPVVAIVGRQICRWVVSPDRGAISNSATSQHLDDQFSTTENKSGNSSLP